MESSMPVGVFIWTVNNYSKTTEARVTIAMTWTNGYGQDDDLNGSHSNHVFQSITSSSQITGVEMRHKTNGAQPYSFAVAVQMPLHDSIESQCTYDSRWLANGDGKSLWMPLKITGNLKNNDDETPSSPGEILASAVAGKLLVLPNQNQEAAKFCLSWDFPMVDFNQSKAPRYKRYTRFYGIEGKASVPLCITALVSSDDWERKIYEWQAPVLLDRDLPKWYKSALFNETYYISDGGSVWIDNEGYDPTQSNLAHSEVTPPDVTNTDVTNPSITNSDATDCDIVGRFGYLESHEYRMYCTYDVHFYASWALIMNWPKLANNMTRDFADATLAECPDQYKNTELMYGGENCARWVKNAVPHDLGQPEEDPWEILNAYNIHDSATWKDLNPKFILQVYRDYVLSGDIQMVKYCWEAMQAAMEYSLQFDTDNDGMIENGGFPDQTYDVWIVTGVSAYCGGLWLAALQAMIATCKLMEKEEIADKDSYLKWQDLYDRAVLVYNEKLWNGSYYNYDESDERQSDSIQSDQLAGHFYLIASGLESYASNDNAIKALQVIYDNCVLGVYNGQRGAVNGVRPTGEIDTTCMQSNEIWTGVTYSVAATMITHNMIAEGFNTARGIYEYVWNIGGLAYQTPEAYFPNGDFRALCYMR
eukprot:Ihof_evm12s129 gene=Ihof_evmTU12s129